MKTARLLYGVFALALLCATPPGLAEVAATLPSIESFFENQTFGGASLSPSARYLAARIGGPGKHDFLVVIDLETNQSKVIAAFKDADVDRFRWVNDERLVYNLTEKDVGQGDLRYAPGLFAVNRDGSGYIQLAQRERYLLEDRLPGGVHRLLPWNTYLLEVQGPPESEYIYVQSPEYNNVHELRDVNLLRLNTLTGKATVVPRPGQVRYWRLDHKGEPRLAVALEDRKSTVHYRDPGSGTWRIIASYSAYTDDQGYMRPLGFDADGTLYVVAYGNGDTTAVHTFNTTTGKLSPEPLIVTRGYDFDGALISRQNKVLGVRYTTDATATVWFDPGMKELQEKVDKVLPATVNLLSVAHNSNASWVLVRAYSDVVPVTYFLYNSQTGVLNKVGESRPHIDSKQMGHQEFVRYKARDGLDIPALLTLPRGATGKNLPMVVLVHGGPWVRGESWGWNAQAQFLASRGYAVLEPEFRGSQGFGLKHFSAGFKQWGLAMQNDLADGVRWAIGKGIVDPKRVCIAGASYGGYATLMGLVNDPDLYKCGIDWAGVTDINLMYNDTWYARSDFTEDYKKYGMPELVGDQVKDAAQLKATSPIMQAARIRQPLLLAYGGADQRVPIFHGKKFYDAVKDTNKNVEWIEYSEEGHGWYLEKNNIDFWGRVEKFLDKQIGPGAVQ
jgi:dipeptidyl aminopeptidase/acylaminoacyl peptidase